MSKEPDPSLYYSTVLKQGLYSNERNLRTHMETIFRDIDLRGVSFLDIGGGSGLYSFYVASQGAKRAICLEPEAHGSTSGITSSFENLARTLGLESAELQQVTFQDFDAKGQLFDLILLYNSINHLDEDAYIKLLTDSEAQTTYREIIGKLWAISNKGAKIIICDCSPRNFYRSIGLTNPFARTIEWHKHHTPEVVAGLLAETGFIKPVVRWSSFNSLGKLGRAFLANRLAAYFLMSHYCLTMEKPA